MIRFLLIIIIILFIANIGLKLYSLKTPAFLSKKEKRNLFDKELDELADKIKNQT